MLPFEDPWDTHSVLVVLGEDTVEQAGLEVRNRAVVCSGLFQTLFQRRRKALPINLRLAA